MTARLPFTLGAALAMALLATILIGRTQTRPPLIVRPNGLSFSDRWPILSTPSIVPKEIRVIPITIRPKPQPVIEQIPEMKMAQSIKTKPKRERISRKRIEYDICRGKGKKYTNNKRSWRCKR